jgi:DNA-binding NarL/FixJ family response regulator
VRVVIVADGALLADSVRGAVRSVPSLHVVGFIDGRRSSSQALAQTGHDLILVYAASRTAASANRIADLRAESDAKLILLTSDMDPEWLRVACQQGADAVVSAAVGAAALGSLIRQIALGAVYHSLATEPQEAVATPPARCDLTARELEILQLVAAGASNGQVAHELWVTEQTVKFHLSNTYRKLGVSNRTEAAHYAHVHGILPPRPERIAAVAA